MSGVAKKPTSSLEEMLYLSVALGLSLSRTRNKLELGHPHLEDESNKSNRLRSAARDLISTRKDIQEFVSWLKTPSIDGREEENDEAEGEDEDIFKAPPIPPDTTPIKSKQSTSTGLSGTASTDSEAQDSLASTAPRGGQSQSQSQAGTLMALLRAYDEHAHQPDVQQTIKYVASLL